MGLRIKKNMVKSYPFSLYHWSQFLINIHLYLLNLLLSHTHTHIYTMTLYHLQSYSIRIHSFRKWNLRKLFFYYLLFSLGVLWRGWEKERERQKKIFFYGTLFYFHVISSVPWTVEGVFLSYWFYYESIHLFSKINGYT